MTCRGLIALGLLLASWPAAAQWTQFRGPRGDGQAPDASPPLSWSEAHNIAWKVEVPGKGFSSPVVLGGQVWLTTAHDEERSLRALAFDAEDGRLLHDVEVFRPAAWQEGHADNSYASPTPALEDGRLYVHFGTYGTACLDTRDGRVLWRNEELKIEHEVGPGSSPILYRHLLIVHFDGTDQRFVAAFHKTYGKIAWRVDRSRVLERKGTHRKAFSTPLVVEHQGKTQLISPAAGQVSAYLPESGLEIWRVRYEGYSNVPQPVAADGRTYVISGYLKPHLYAIRMDGLGDVTESHVDWTYHWQVPANPSPLLLGERLYMVSDWGNATWLDVTTGQDIWRHRLREPFSASPLLAGGRIYNFSREGRTVVLSPRDTYQELAVNQLEGTIRATPAVTGRALYIRTTSHLYRIEEIAETAPAD